MARTHSTRNYWETVLSTPTTNVQYSQPPSSRQHTLTPSNPPPISEPFPHHCPICNTIFSGPRSYHDHMPICTGRHENLYVCHQCGIAYIEHTNLIKHRKLMMALDDAEHSIRRRSTDEQERAKEWAHRKGASF